MAKDDFDINFDFDQEYEFDPKEFLTGEEYDENIDLTEFSDEDLNLDLDLDFEDAPEDAPPAPQQADAEGGFDLDIDLDSFLIGDQEDATGFFDESLSDEVPSFAQRDRSSAFDIGGYGATPELPRDVVPTNLDDEPVPPPPPEVSSLQGHFGTDAAPSAEEKPSRRRERKKAPKAPKEPKEAKPTIFTKFFDLYFAPVLHKETFEEPQDPNNPRRRRRKSKVQIFKEVYLPPIIVCLCAILVLSFGVGSLTGFIEEQRQKQAAEESRLDSSASAAEQAKTDAQIAMAEAERLALGYDYAGAIEELDAFLNSVPDATAFPELATLRSAYVAAQSTLKEHKDPSLIPNLSFHVLIQDMERARNDEEYGGQYNLNFISTAEFTRILGELYNNNYVLVDFKSFTESTGDKILPKSILLPDGKKPIMLTETMVNYFCYMINDQPSNAATSERVKPDKNGDGFASRLVLDDYGNIKAEYMDAEGVTHVGDYDFVPILETFIEEHPDFVYRDARATLAVCGYEGIFGYRINTTYHSEIGQSYYEEQVAGARKIVQALRDRGYTLACYTYNNENYGKINANQITADLQLWTQQITPVLGDVDVLVYAREADIADYGGNSFTVMYTSGFRYFVTSSTVAPSTEVNTTYVRQKRLMVTGQYLAHKQDMFSGIFDPNSVLDMTLRGNIPQK